MAFYEKRGASLVREFDLYDFTGKNPDLKDCALKLEITKGDRGKNDWILKHKVTRYDLPIASKETAFTTQDEAKKFGMGLADGYRCGANMMSGVFLSARIEQSAKEFSKMKEMFKNKRK